MKRIFDHKIVSMLAMTVLIFLCISIYQLFVRDWIKSAKFDIEPIERITYFDKKTIKNKTEVLSNIFSQGQDKNSYLNANGYWYVNKEEGYERNIYLDNENEYIKMYYTIFDGMDTNAQDKNQGVGSTDLDALGFNGYGYVTVYIAATNKVIKSDLNTTAQKTRMATGSYRSEIPSMTEFKDFLDFEYGRIRPIFRMVSQKGKNNRFEYYITPLCYTRDSWGLINSDSSELYMMFVFGDYIIYVQEWTYKRSKYDATQLVIDDVSRLLNNADKSYPIS